MMNLFSTTPCPFASKTDDDDLLTLFVEFYYIRVS